MWLYLSNNKLTVTLPTEMGNMNELSKLLCTHYLNSLLDFGILYDYLYIFVMNISLEDGECQLIDISPFASLVIVLFFRLVVDRSKLTNFFCLSRLDIEMNQDR